MTAELRVVTDADQTQALTDALVTELARVAGIYDEWARLGYSRVGLPVLAPLRDLIRAAGIPATPLPRRTR